MFVGRLDDFSSYFEDYSVDTPKMGGTKMKMCTRMPSLPAYPYVSNGAK